MEAVPAPQKKSKLIITGYVLLFVLVLDIALVLTGNASNYRIPNDQTVNLWGIFFFTYTVLPAIAGTVGLYFLAIIMAARNPVINRYGVLYITLIVAVAAACLSSITLLSRTTYEHSLSHNGRRYVIIRQFETEPFSDTSLNDFTYELCECTQLSLQCHCYSLYREDYTVAITNPRLLSDDDRLMLQTNEALYQVIDECDTTNSHQKCSKYALVATSEQKE